MRGTVARAFRRRVYGREMSLRLRAWHTVQRVKGKYREAGKLFKRIVMVDEPISEEELAAHDKKAEPIGFLNKFLAAMKKLFRRRTAKKERERPSGNRKVAKVRLMPSQIISDRRRFTYQRLKKAYRRGEIGSPA